MAHSFDGRGCDDAAHAAPDLVDRLIAQDESSFEELVRSRGPRMLAVAARYLPNRADAEDALQDAFVSVVRNISHFKRQCALDTWLHRIVVNCALMSLRRRRRRPEVRLPESALGGGAASPSRRRPAPSVTELVTTEETRRAVARSIERLPEGQRCVLMLREVGEYELQEVAELLDLGRSTVKMRLHRARQEISRATGDFVRNARNLRSGDNDRASRSGSLSSNGRQPSLTRALWRRRTMEAL